MKTNIPDDQLQDGKPTNKVDKNTIYLSDEELERMPDSDDDYRLPRDLPVPDEDLVDDGELVDDIDDDNEDLIDPDTEISAEEIALLEDAEQDDSSDETRASGLLDDEDEDGDELNEGSGRRNLFNTGEDLDMPKDVTNPDIDQEDEDN